MIEVIDKVQQQVARRLSEILKDVLTLGVDFGLIITPNDQEEVIYRLVEGIKSFFAGLEGETEDLDDTTDFENLSLILEDELDVLVAMEGMVAAARNKYLLELISFSTRLDSVLEDDSLDESRNPLDPEQLFDAFKEAVRPLGLDARKSMTLFRLFNDHVFGNLDVLLEDANQVMVNAGILPDLGTTGNTARRSYRGRQQPRSGSGQDPNETGGFGLDNTAPSESHDEDAVTPELFSLMQDLLHTPAGGAGGTGATGQSIPAGNFVIPAQLQGQDLQEKALLDATANKTVEVVDQSQLNGLLSNIQAELIQRASTSTADGDASTTSGQNIQQALGELLEKEQKEGVINAVDRASSDVIKLVELLYEAIWNDDAVPIPIKELIGRTQIAVIQISLTDQEFFNREDHPVRALLNDFARAGIGWTEVDNLKDDSLYQKIDEMVKKILHEHQGQPDFFEGLVKDFKNYRAREYARGRRLEQRIKHTRQGDLRKRFAGKLVTQRIEERILGRELHPFVSELLNTMFREFMVMLVLKEGPGSNAWKQAINTIDVLLWSVQPHEQKGDRDRLEVINPRLLNNLKRAFTIASVEPEKIEKTLDELKQVQEESFKEEEVLPLDALLASEQAMSTESSTDEEPSDTEAMETSEEMLAEDDEFLQRVDSYSVGTWFEFDMNSTQHIRCKLAAKINAIDKLIFVNRQGVKVIEKTKMGLALELKHQSAQVISDGLLFSRALESVIGELREVQSERT